MSKEILNLKPELIWKYFYELTQIPRPSKFEAKVIEFVEKTGKQLGLETIKDEVGNVIIRKPATKGMENRKTIILQGHLDMVPQKNSDKVHDFEKDPIDAFIDGEWVKAKGTTLGADNGIGVAAALAVLEDKSLVHGPVEAFFTIDEETGMTGAFNIKPGVLKGDILLNMDSEDEGELYVGCAGGTNANALFRYKKEPVRPGDIAYKLSLTGLKGGHSGVDIHLQRANAIKLLFRFLKHAVAKHHARLAAVDGGSLRNAIPREAFCVVTIPEKNKTDFLKCLTDHETIFRTEYATVDGGLKFNAISTDMPGSLIEEMVQDDLIHAITICPNGVVRMSDDMKGLTETSNNLALVKSDDKGEIQVLCLLRSSVDSAKEYLESVIESVFSLAGAEITFDGQYPGWKPNLDSPILKTMQKVYQDKFGKIPEIRAIHAGLECGILGGVYPHWDMISFGPTIRFPHSPDEKINIETVEKFWDFLVETLKNAPLK